VNLPEEVNILEKELKKGAYPTNLVRRTYISKTSGGQRRSFNWKEFSKKLKERYPIQRPFTESLDKQMVMTI